MYITPDYLFTRIHEVCRSSDIVLSNSGISKLATNNDLIDSVQNNPASADDIIEKFALRASLDEKLDEPITPRELIFYIRDLADDESLVNNPEYARSLVELMAQVTGMNEIYSSDWNGFSESGDTFDDVILGRRKRA